MIHIAVKRWLAFLIVFFLMTPAAFAGVTVSSPAPGSTSGSPVQFVASATGTNPISSMRIYVDGASVYTAYASSLNTAVAMTSGGHAVVVQAWDTKGNVYKNSFSLTVGSSTTATPTSTSTTASGSGVSISSPGNGSTVGSPIHVAASASAANPISAMRIYLDGNSMYTVNANQLDTSVASSNGSHSVVVQAWDTTGAVYKQALTVNVNSTSAPSSSSISSAPSNATAFNEIQRMPSWENCTVCAGAGANGPAAVYGTTQGVSSPSLSGNSMEFYLGGSTPYSDAIWWKQLGASNSATHFQYDLDFYLTNPQFAEALEFDVNQSIGNKKFIFGTQCGVISDGQWDVWDTAGDTWRPTGVACPMPAAYQWHHLTWEFYRDDTYTHYVAVTLDGVKHYVNVAYQAKPWGANEINVAFQMDGNVRQDAYNAWLDNVTLRYW